MMPPLLRPLATLMFAAGLLLAGCGPQEDKVPQVQPSRVLSENAARQSATDGMIGVSDEITATRPWRLAFLMKNFAWASPYWRRTHEGAERARQELGIYLQVLGVEEHAVEDQIRQLDSLIREGRVDGIIIAPLDTNRLPPVVEKAATAGIPVIVYDTPLNADTPVTTVSFDNFSGGRLLGRWVVEQLGGRGRVLILEGPPGHQNALERRNGMISGLSEGDIDVLGLRTGYWLRAEAHRIMTDWLERFDEIDAVMAGDDLMALGVVDALAENGRDGIMVTGFDANAEALIAIRQGRMHATVDQSPRRQARRAVQLMVRYLETGEAPPEKVLWKDIPLITAENVVEFQR